MTTNDKKIQTKSTSQDTLTKNTICINSEGTAVKWASNFLVVIEIMTENCRDQFWGIHCGFNTTNGHILQRTLSEKLTLKHARKYSGVARVSGARG